MHRLREFGIPLNAQLELGVERRNANGAITIVLLLLLGGCGLKSGDTLRQQFNENKGVLAEIVDMQRHDPKVIRIAPTFTRLDTDWGWPRKNIGFSEGRWNKYRALFQEAGITDGIEEYKDDTDFDVFFYVSSEGLVAGGTTRGFAYMERPPKYIVGALDKCPHGAGTPTCFVPLEKNWYLYEDVTE